MDAYYAGSSSARALPRVSIPLLCIQAANDPIAPAAAIPYDAVTANPNLLLAVTPTGGHLGWAAGPGAPFGHPWTDGAVTEWLAAVTQVQRGTALRSDAGAQALASDSSGGPSNGGGEGSGARAAATAVPAASSGTEIS